MLISSLRIKNLFQGWLFLADFIPANNNSLSEMILLPWFHPCQQKFSPKDDSSLLISSLRIKIFSQGWFFPPDFIPANKNSPPEMILLPWFHPCRQKFSHKDDSSLLISSLTIKIFSQGWFSPVNLSSSLKLCDLKFHQRAIPRTWVPRRCYHVPIYINPSRYDTCTLNNSILAQKGYGYPDDGYFSLKLMDISRGSYIRNPKSHKLNNWAKILKIRSENISSKKIPLLSVSERRGISCIHINTVPSDSFGSGNDTVRFRRFIPSGSRHPPLQTVRALPLPRGDRRSNPDWK